MKTQIFKYFLILFLFFSISKEGKSHYIARHNLSSSAYQKAYDMWKSKGYELKHISGYVVRNNPRFAAIWVKKSGPAVKGYHGMTADRYQQRVNSMKAQGYRPKQVNVYTIGNKDYYNAIFEKNNGTAWEARHLMTASKYQREFDFWIDKGYRLIDVSGYSLNGKSRFAAIWIKKRGPAFASHHNMTSENYQKKTDLYVRRGYRTTHASSYSVNGKVYYAAIWEKRRGKAWIACHGLTEANYQNQVDNFHYQGYRLRKVDALNYKGKNYFVGIWEEGAFPQDAIRKMDRVAKKFMNEYRIPGLQIAIAKDEKLVFAKGYGYANKEKKIVMSPRVPGRIASISKPITAVAIMKLHENRTNFPLNSKVFGNNSLLGNTYGSEAYSNREKAIRLHHLLEHTAGGNAWDNNLDNEDPVTNDPMFTNLSFDHKELIDWTLDNRNPDFAPGNYYSYSNFAYCVLGRIIENVSKQSYEKWVRNNVLKKCGINQMFIAGDKKEDKRSREMVYYGKGGDDPYKWKVRRMDSHGGWAASTIDLLRFAVRVDGKSIKKDIIKKSTFDKMMRQDSYAANPVNTSNYAKGWRVTASGAYLHGGSLPGTYSRLANRGDDYSYAIILNSKSDKSGFRDAFLDTINKFIQTIKDMDQIPSHDLF